jgi:DNA-binding Lrp family transcriptional regulator
LRVKSSSRKGDENMNVKNKDLLIISYLRQDARMKLTNMSKITRIPVSTLFDKIKTYEGGLVKRHTALVRFDRLGYHAKTLIAFSMAPKDRQKLLELLDKSRNVNSLHKINNGWDYMAEVVFPGVKEIEEFIKKGDVHAGRASQEAWGGRFLEVKDWEPEAAVGIGYIKISA